MIAVLGGFSKYTIEELKEIIRSRGLSWAGCRQKDDFVRVLDGPADEERREAERKEKYEAGLRADGERTRTIATPGTGGMGGIRTDDHESLGWVPRGDGGFVLKDAGRRALPLEPDENPKPPEERWYLQESDDEGGFWEDRPVSPKNPGYRPPKATPNTADEEPIITGEDVVMDDEPDEPDEPDDSNSTRSATVWDFQPPPGATETKRPAKKPKARAEEPVDPDNSDSIHDSDSSANSEDSVNRLLSKVRRRMNVGPKKSVRRGKGKGKASSKHLNNKLIAELHTRLTADLQTRLNADSEEDRIAIVRRADEIRRFRGTNFGKIAKKGYTYNPRY